MRLIDADALKHELKVKRDYLDTSTAVGRGQYIALNKAITMLDEQPTVDAVAVVRCEQCRYWGKDGFGDYRKCSIDGAWHKPSFYCASGERREEH